MTGFTKAPCEVCQRKTWHYQQAGAKAPHCTDHSDWTPHVTHVTAEVVGGTTMRIEHPTITPPMAVKQTGLKVQRLCGHVTRRAEKALCGHCLHYLHDTGCEGCVGRVIPLPYCPCQRVYTLDERGEVVVSCDVCWVPTRPTARERVKVGRWGKVVKQVGWSIPDRQGHSQPLYEEKRMPFIHEVWGCPACALRYYEVQQVTREGHVAFLEV